MRPQNELPTIAEWPRRRATIAPSAVAIDDGSRSLTYGEFASLVDATAEALADRGYRRGDRIATVTRNSADHLVLFFACAARGVALAPLSWRLTEPELDAQLAIIEPAAVLRDTVLDLPRVSGTSPDDSSGLLIVFTSGTAARPKAAVLTAENCRATNQSLQGALGLTSDDVVLGVLPQFHAAGWNSQPLLAVGVGARLSLAPTFDAGDCLRGIGAGVTALMGVPSTWQALSRHPSFESTDLSSLRIAVVGGAPTPPGLLRVWRDRGVTLRQGYGLTEAGPNVLCQAPGDAAGPSGRPYPGVEIRTDDGELLVRSGGVFAGYFRDPDATAAAFADDWLRTGDVARLEPDGQVTIVDRAKDIYISGGENVAPAEIEAVLLGHPLVVDAAVVGVADDTWGEVGLAYVVAEGVSEAELLSWCRERLAGFKVPSRVEFVSELPRSGIDKVVRRRLAGAS